MPLTPEPASPPVLIPGIYDYCDSWCERCLFTTRCRSFQLQQANGLTTPPDPNASLVAQLTEALELTRQYLEKLDKNAPTGPDGHPASPADQQTLEETALVRRQKANEHPAALLATAYMAQTGTWLAQERTMLQVAGHQQLDNVRLGLCTEEQAMSQLIALQGACEQIRWYRTLIPVKTKAALRAVDEPTTDQQLLTYYTGKAKLVLVSIDQSLFAWQTILNYYPHQTDSLLDMLVLLNQLTRQLETLFPQARAFQRPGLD